MASKFADFFLGPKGQRKQRLQDILLAGLAPSAQMETSGIPELEAIRGAAGGITGAIQLGKQRKKESLENMLIQEELRKMLKQREFGKRQMPQELKELLGSETFGETGLTPQEATKAILELRGLKTKKEMSAERAKTISEAAKIRTGAKTSDDFKALGLATSYVLKSDPFDQLSDEDKLTQVEQTFAFIKSQLKPAKTQIPTSPPMIPTTAINDATQSVLNDLKSGKATREDYFINKRALQGIGVNTQIVEDFLRTKK